MEQLTEQQVRDMKVLVKFVSVYCRAKHDADLRRTVQLPAEMGSATHASLCQECESLVAHAVERRRKCPLDPKPSCKHCHIHCYSKAYRDRIREIMAFSGRKLILRGRLDYLWHYFF